MTRLARPSGGFAMVAIDQRESLRAMFAEVLHQPVPEPLIVDFKLAVAERLAPFASAMLFDRLFAMPAFEAAAASPTCARIMAADDLTQSPGGPVEDTDIDLGVDPMDMRARGAVALKLLVIWRGAETAQRCVDLATRFMGRCHDAGLLGIIEAIVQAPSTATHGFDREDAIVDAARQLSVAAPDLYKCQVPFQGRGSDDDVARLCDQITSILSCPWVVLSMGVAIDDFPHALEIACRAGASGFLAGRAIWADAVHAANYRERLDAISAPRLRRLAEIVDTFGSLA
jgi:sulfofructosephosphate aldolase